MSEVFTVGHSTHLSCEDKRPGYHFSLVRHLLTGVFSPFRIERGLRRHVTVSLGLDLRAGFLYSDTHR